eukprot:16276-Heterococcus_DN1.PRE.6
MNAPQTIEQMEEECQQIKRRVDKRRKIATDLGKLVNTVMNTQHHDIEMKLDILHLIEDRHNTESQQVD